MHLGRNHDLHDIKHKLHQIPHSMKSWSWIRRVWDESFVTEWTELPLPITSVQFVGMTFMTDPEVDEKRRQILKNITELFAGLSVGPGRALTDTAAQAPTIGARAERFWRRRLWHMGLCPVMVCETVSGQVNGVGSTKIKYVCDYPCGLCGLDTIIRFTVLEDGLSDIPSLLSVDVLRDRKALISLDHEGDTLTVRDDLDNQYAEDLVREWTGHVSQDLANFANKRFWKINPRLEKLLEYNPFLTRNLFGSNEFGTYKFRDPTCKIDPRFVSGLPKSFYRSEMASSRSTPAISHRGETMDAVGNPVADGSDS